METLWLAGAVQPLAAANVTVCEPTDKPVTVAPLVCGVPLSTAHWAFETLSVTCKAPVGGIITYVPVIELVWFAAMDTLWLPGVVQPLNGINVTVCKPADKPLTTAPLFCDAPLSTNHWATDGLTVISREPV